MGAIELLPAGSELDERRKDWMEHRRSGVSASEIAAILGISPWDSAFSLYWYKKGELPEEPDNPRMALGRHLESYVADQFAEMYPEFIVTKMGLCAAEKRPWQLCTPDRILMPGNWPLEIKTSSVFDGWGPLGSDIIPLHYRTQVMWQMDVLGAERGYVAVLFLLTQEIRVYEIPFDAEDAEAMRKAALNFREMLVSGEPPEIDGSAASRRAATHVFPAEDEAPDAPVSRRLVLSYRSAIRNAQVADARRKLMENRLRVAMGESKRAIDARTGERVATRSTYARAGHVVGPGTVDRLIPAKVKERESDG